MSDSDDTDDLLLIPPNKFLVPLLDSDDRSDCSSYTKSKSGVVSELIDHMQSLEYRITAIESKESLNNSFNSRRLSVESIMSCKQTLPTTKLSVSENSNVQKTPTKHFQCSPITSTPNDRRKLSHTNETHKTAKSRGNYQNNLPTNSIARNKHDNLKSFSEHDYSQTCSVNKSPLHVGIRLSKKEQSSMPLSPLHVSENKTCTNTYSSSLLLNSSSASGDRYNLDRKPIKDMSLSEVDEYLHEIDNNDKLLSTRNCNSNGQLLRGDSKNLPNRNYAMEKDDRDKRKLDPQKLKFSDYQLECEKKKDVTDYSLFNDTSFSSFDTDKFMTEFKSWSPTYHQDMNDSKINIVEHRNYEENEKFSNPQNKTNYTSNKSDFSVESKKVNAQQYFDTNLIPRFADEFTKSQTLSSVSTPQVNQNISNSHSCPNIFKTPSNTSISNPLEVVNNKSEFSNNGTNGNYSREQNSANILHCVESQNQRPQRLFTLSDFWTNDSNKSHEEKLRMKLEEERFRREHIEQLIQNQQKKLLEQEEKLAVAVRLDNEKNSIICQFQASWKKTKQKLCELETDRENRDKLLKTISDKYHMEMEDYQEQIKKYKDELSKALNLATGYKDKGDSLIKEKVDILNSHANELQNYKSLVQQAEARYEELKMEYQKLVEKNHQTEETLMVVQQDFNKELSKSSDVRTEMTVIHKALDACENELIILRQEKENLQLKLKEEVNRNNILEQSKASLISAVNEAKESEKLAKNEIKSLTDQYDKLRAELRDVYQKQVDEVVKAKLQEFQTQLDSAEMVFQNEIETKQLAIAECAARKIKSVIDKHRLEINLVEEKHKEEKKLYEIKVAQATQKAAMLDAQLNSYRKSKNQLVEQLHSMLQKQWQQALLIISGGNIENMPSLQKINVDKLFTLPSEANLELMPNHCSTLHTEPMKLESQKSSVLQNVQIQERQNESLITLTSHDETPLSSRKETNSDLRKYIKMILDMQQSKEDYSKPKFFNGNSAAHKESREKQSSPKDVNTSNDGSSTWQPVSEISVHDTSEYLSVPQKFDFRGDHKQKPPWK